MAQDTYEFTGKTVDEAVAEGLSKLGVARSDIAVEVLSKGSRGIFGIGSEPARVRITLEPARPTIQSEEQVAPSAAEDGEPSAVDQEAEVLATAPDEERTETESAEKTATAAKPEVAVSPEKTERRAESAADAEAKAPAEISDEELATMAAEMLGEIVRLMGFEADIVTSWQEPDDTEGSPYLLLDIEGEDLGALIGRRGETLASLQYLVRLMVNQRIKQWRNIVVDVEKYKERRVTQLNQLALRMAEQVAESGRAVALEPMPPNERRLVHLALRDHPEVYTQSSGEGDRRKVNIVPKDKA